uniref:Uncharacterized protein n=2 Tax=Oryza TaxID=4527 RepID=Q7XI10_ORYSJ|nr:hypothetical protein [Oryza sativa Japonica Group]BAD31073.1 hypothetical protein [Oryza sativa Japonica Group]
MTQCHGPWVKAWDIPNNFTRVIFVLLFGASAVLVFTGAMPFIFIQYAEVVSRVTLIVGCF